jgi:hypothetical protein
LAAATDDGPAMIPPACIAFTAALKPLPTNLGTTCSFSDTTATKTLMLFGDSQASMWLPAFNIAGELLHWKILLEAKDGCAPWISPVTSQQGSSACNDWVRGDCSRTN